MSVTPLAPGHFRIDLTLAFATNGASRQIPLPRQLQHVKEVWLNEYTIVGPNGGALLPSVWRLDLGNELSENESSNAPGKGTIISINGATVAHVHYDTPVVICTNNCAQLNMLNCRVSSVALATGAVADATFSEAVFKLSFICEDPTWTPDLTLEIAKVEPRRAQARFSTRTPFF